MNIEKSITLNIPGDLSDSDWDKVMSVYRNMDGWIEGHDLPYWFGTEQNEIFITASVEPSGLVIFGKVNDLIWIGWLTKLCAKLTKALNKEIYDAGV